MKNYIIILLILILTSCTNRDKMDDFVKDYNKSVEILKKRETDVTSPNYNFGIGLPDYIYNTYAKVSNDSIVSIIIRLKYMNNEESISSLISMSLMPNFFISTMKNDIKNNLLKDNIHLRIVVKDYYSRKISELLVNKDNIDKHESIENNEIQPLINLYNSKLPIEEEKGLKLMSLGIDLERYLIKNYEVTDELILAILKYPELEKINNTSVEELFKPQIDYNFYYRFNVKGVKTVLKDKNKKILKEIKHNGRPF
jgi:hypothetical protein